MHIHQMPPKILPTSYNSYNNIIKKPLLLAGSLSMYLFYHPGRPGLKFSRPKTCHVRKILR